MDRRGLSYVYLIKVLDRFWFCQNIRAIIYLHEIVAYLKYFPR